MRGISLQSSLIYLGCLSSLHQILSVSQPHHVQPQRAGPVFSVALPESKINIAKPVFNPPPALFYYFDPRESIQLTLSKSLLHTNPQITVHCFLSPVHTFDLFSTNSSSLASAFRGGITLHSGQDPQNRAKSPITSESSNTYLQRASPKSSSLFYTFLQSPQQPLHQSSILNTPLRSSSRAISSFE